MQTFSMGSDDRIGITIAACFRYAINGSPFAISFFKRFPPKLNHYTGFGISLNEIAIFWHIRYFPCAVTRMILSISSTAVAGCFIATLSGFHTLGGLLSKCMLLTKISIGSGADQGLILISGGESQSVSNPDKSLQKVIFSLPFESFRFHKFIYGIAGLTAMMDFLGTGHESPHDFPGLLSSFKILPIQKTFLATLEQFSRSNSSWEILSQNDSLPS